jgi:hypothetical protein
MYANFEKQNAPVLMSDYVQGSIARLHNYLLCRLMAIPLVLSALCSSSSAQQLPPPPTTPNPPGENLVSFFSRRTPYEFWLTCLIGVIGLLIIGLTVWSVRSLEHRRPEDVTRPIIIVTVVTGTLILVTAGYSNEQIAPAFGLFGTIVGYILGRLPPPRTPDSANGDQGTREPA